MMTGDDTKQINPSLGAAAPRRRGRTIVGAICVIAALAIGWFLTAGPQNETAQKQSPQGRTNPPVGVSVATVERADLTVSLPALGTVTSLSTVLVRAQVSGQLQSTGFAEGQDVKAGDVLAQIDPRPFQATLDQAKAQLKRDEAQLAAARVDLDRYQGLAAQNAVPRQSLDTQTALVAQYSATVDADKAQVETASINLGYTTIRAPVDGRAGLRQVDAGNYITPGDTNGLVVLTRLKPISVVFSVPEDQLNRIAARMRSGASLPVRVFDRTGRTAIGAGTLATFDSQIDQTTGTIKLKALLANDDLRLFPNQFVNVVLDVETREGVVAAPTAAIQHGVPGAFAYLLDSSGSKVSVRPVTLGVVQGERVEITSGLMPGDRIVMEGADRLREGAPVMIRPEAGAPMAAATPAAERRRHGADGPAPTRDAANQPARTP